MSKVTTETDKGFEDSFLHRQHFKNMLRPIEVYNHGALVIAYKQGYLKGFFGSMYKPTYTTTQLEVVHALQKHDYWLIAAACLNAWKEGETYYIDSRVSVPKRVFTLMSKANKQVGKTYRNGPTSKPKP